MFERLKWTLIESYVGAIALGYLLAQAILNFVEIFVSPVAAWVERNYYQSIIPRTTSSAGPSFQDALPELERFLVLLLVWYLLLRWLYFKPFKRETSAAAPSPEQPV